ncbi:MAG TPA: M15 family metallopeptidase [Chitinophagaceae bacterium]|nr:M15 family metallopeptidase [Chitinophagaceae bacterium]
MNLPKQLQFLFIVCLAFNTIAGYAQAVTPPLSKYGVPVIKEMAMYENTVKADSNKQMVEIKSMVPGIVYDLRYASDKNFMRRNMYPGKTSYTFLRLPAARALAQVQKDLNERGMGLKVFDAYRPYSVTEKFWELVLNEKYVADPKKGSGHNRGISVDLTIIYTHNGKELQMPTGFDNFSDTAHHSFMNIPFEALQNRKVLKDVMEKYGFKMFESEWWHYSWPDDKNYFEAMDIPFAEFRNADKKK